MQPQTIPFSQKPKTIPFSSQPVSKPVEPLQPQTQNYGERVRGAYKKAGQDIVSGISNATTDVTAAIYNNKPLDVLKGYARAGLRTVGGVTGAAFAPIMEAPGIKQGIEATVSGISKIPGVKTAAKEVDKFARYHPEVAKDIQNIVDIGTLGPVKAIEQPLAQTLKKTTQALLTPSEQAVKTNIENLFNKAIKPTAQKTMAQAKSYRENLVKALRTIKDNAQDLNIQDVTGEIITGRTPQTINELAQGLDQTKKLVFGQYDALARQAGNAGVKINTAPVVKELESLMSNKALQLTNPEVLNYAKGWAQRLWGFKDIDAQTTQSIVQNLNNSLQAFYKNPSYESASKIAVDAGIANNFRKMLDTAIEGATGKEYQALKNQYGALKAIERDVIRAAARDARKNVKGLLDYTDIFTGGQMLSGILSLNPAMFTKGAIERGIKEYVKFLNDPNRAVNSIFKKLDDFDGKKGIRNKIDEYMKNPKIGMSIEDVSKRPDFVPEQPRMPNGRYGNKTAQSTPAVSNKVTGVQPYKESGDLTTKILKDLQGKTTVSKQYILDATNRGDLKQAERDVIRDVLENHGVNTTDRNVATDFIDSVRTKKVGGGSLTPKQKLDFEIEARQLAPGWGINPELPPSKLADAFDNYLSRSKDVVDVPEFAKKVKAELLPLKVNSTALPKNIDPDDASAVLEYKRKSNQPVPRYENIALPDELRGDVKDYRENIYESPIKTSAGSTHFGNSSDNYFGHTRVEDMADAKTRRVIEVQSDLYQKGNLQREVGNYSDKSDLTRDGMIKRWEDRNKDIAKLQQYNDPTAHFRMIREEVRKAAQDGKTKLQFPTGETAMKIEGLGSNAERWRPGAVGNEGGDYLMDVPLKNGMEITDGNSDWIITDVLGDGKFKAIPKPQNGEIIFKNGKAYVKPKDPKDEYFNNPIELGESRKESFDISGKVDTNNPIYKFYEKDIQKYLNKYGGKKVTDDNGVTWIEIDIKPEHKGPVEAFGKINTKALLATGGATAAGAVAASQLQDR